jgi:hypothetical protein
MVISDLNYLQPVSGDVTGAGDKFYFKYVKFKQYNYNKTEQYAKAKTYKGNAYAENYNETYQDNYISIG